MTKSNIPMRHVLFLERSSSVILLYEIIYVGGGGGGNEIWRNIGSNNASKKNMKILGRSTSDLTFLASDVTRCTTKLTPFSLLRLLILFSSLLFKISHNEIIVFFFMESDIMKIYCWKLRFSAHSIYTFIIYFVF